MIYLVDWEYIVASTPVCICIPKMGKATNLRTQNSELRTQNSELRTQNSELRNLGIPFGS
jgi:hypothetical protein